MSKPTLFVRIPATASASIIDALIATEESCCIVKRPRYLKDRRTLRKAQHVSFNHRSVPCMVRLGIVSADWVDKRFTFSFVRNPWERLLSVYARQKPRPTPTFDEFVYLVTTTAIHGLGPGNITGHSMANPQLSWLRDDRGRIFVDFIGRFEHLKRDWQELCRRAEINPVPALPHRNRRRGLRGRYQSYYTPETRALVASRYAEEIERFAYRFE